MLPPTDCAILRIEMEVFVSVFVLLVMVNAESLSRFEVFPADAAQLGQVKRFGDSQGSIFGKSTRFADFNHPVTLWVRPATEEKFTDFLMCRGMKFNVVTDGQSTRQRVYEKKLRNGVFNFETYHRHHVTTLNFPPLEFYLEKGRSKAAGEEATVDFFLPKFSFKKHSILAKAEIASEPDKPIFTDGSKTAEDTGACIFPQDMDLKESIALGRYSTVSQVEINDYLQTLALEYPRLVTLENAGKSAEGRDLLAVKISAGGNGTKPLILIEAGMHAIEWISSVQALYIIQQLVENTSLRYLVHNVDWLILPVVNPDGYEFTLTVSKNWRKTRSRGVNCFGTDGNRNFDFHWAQVGTSWDECHPMYHGPRPFSEPETQALRNLVLKYAHQARLYLSLHSFGQFILYPWGHTYVPATNAAELDWLAKRAAAAIERFAGSQYSVGSIPRMLYLSSGDSTSWAKGVAGVDLAFVIELPPKMDRFQSTDSDHQIPPKCIKFVVEEVLQGVKVFHGYVEYKYTKS